MRVNASIAWGCADSTVFVVHAPVRPEQSHWDEFMEDVRAQQGLTGAVVMANNSRLTPLQRAEIQKWYEANKARGALVTNSRMMRGIVTAMNWFNVDMRAFSPEDLDDALGFVRLPSDSWDNARRVLRILAENVEKKSARALSGS